MSTEVSRIPSLSTASSRQPSDADGSFAHHGFWAPGVRLFRKVPFSQKAQIVSLLFLLPLLLVTVKLLRTKQAAIERLTKDRAGVAALKAHTGVLGGVLEARNATRATLGGFAGQAPYAGACERTDKALLAFSATVAADEAPLGLKPSLDKLSAAWRETSSAQNGVRADGRTVFGRASEASVKLIGLLPERTELLLDSHPVALT